MSLQLQQGFSIEVAAVRPWPNLHLLERLGESELPDRPLAAPGWCQCVAIENGCSTRIEDVSFAHFEGDRPAVDRREHQPRAKPVDGGGRAADHSGSR